VKEKVRNGKPVFEVSLSRVVPPKTSYYDLPTGEPAAS
jgi:hypothetical protein